MNRRFFYQFNVNNEVGMNPKEGGLRFSGKVIASDAIKAKEKVEKIANKLAESLEDTYFGHTNSNSPFDLGGLFDREEEIPSLSCIPLHITLLTISDDYIISPMGNAHDDSLTNVINEIWANDDVHSTLKLILGAIYERDCKELANFYDDECIWWKADEISFDEMCDNVSFEEVAYQLFNYIMDDEDYKMVISFIRPRWIKEEWWELLNGNYYKKVGEIPYHTKKLNEC